MSNEYFQKRRQELLLKEKENQSRASVKIDSSTQTRLEKIEYAENQIWRFLNQKTRHGSKSCTSRHVSKVAFAAEKSRDTRYDLGRDGSPLEIDSTNREISGKQYKGKAKPGKSRNVSKIAS